VTDPPVHPEPRGLPNVALNGRVDG
jgi:hypothetical protein